MQDDEVSPESLVYPANDLDDVQFRTTGERLPELVLELCDRCQWCLTYFNRRGIVEKCPLCGQKASLIPMKLNEVCSIVKSGKRGIEIHFDRQNPLR
jgi:hypothetical protein